MADHAYADAPLWTVLTALANMPDGQCRVVDLTPRVLTETGHPGAHRAIGRLIASGYAVIDDGWPDALPGPSGRRATVRITVAGLRRWRQGRDYVGQLGAVRMGTQEVPDQRERRRSRA